MLRVDKADAHSASAMKILGRINPSLRAVTVGLVGGLLTVPVTAWAAGMPQLDFSTPLTVSQLVWGAIIFLVLYIILSRSGLPLVASVLEERAAHIGRDLEGARAAKASADAGIAEAEQAVAAARAEAQAAVKVALEEAKVSAATQSEALNARLETRLQEAEAQISQARTAAMGALRQVATETALSIVTRLTGVAPDSARLEGAIGNALTTRGVG
jgi:F-type H+-transporting ATPase subunit b